VTPRINDLELDNDAGNLCSLLWAFTEVGASNADLFAALAERAVVEMRAFRPAVLSDVRNTCFWCFKRASAKSWSTQGKQAYSRDFAHGVFFEALSAAVLQNIDELSPITCVYLMWSFSKARVHDQELFDAVERRVGRQVADLDRCGLTMFCWNYAYSGTENEDVYRLVKEDTLRPERMKEMAPRDVAGILSAFAKAGVRDQELTDAIVEHSCGLLKDGISQSCHRGPGKSLKRDVYIGDKSAVDGAVDAFDMMSLSELLPALADLEAAPAELLEVAGEYVAMGLSQTDHLASRFVRFPRSVVRVLRALARMDAGGDRLFEAAAPYCTRNLDEYNTSDVISLLWTWAARRPRTDPTLADLHMRLRENLVDRGIRNFTEQEASDAQWALDKLGINDDELREALQDVQPA